MLRYPTRALVLKLAGGIWLLILAVRLFQRSDLSMGLLIGVASIALLVLVGEDFVKRRKPKDHQ